MSNTFLISVLGRQSSMHVKTHSGRQSSSDELLARHTYVGRLAAEPATTTTAKLCAGAHTLAEPL